MSNIDDLELHTLALVRDFLRSRGYTEAQAALDVAVPLKKGEPMSRDVMLHNLTLTRLLKARRDPLPDSTLELVVDTMLRRSRSLRKYEQENANSEISEAPVRLPTDSSEAEVAVVEEVTAEGIGGLASPAAAATLPALSPCSLSAITMKSGEEVSPAQLAGMHKLILGRAEADFLDAWRRQGFGFSQHPAVPFGLNQLKGGTCGIVAVVQAYFLRALLFSDASNAPKLEGEQRLLRGPKGEWRDQCLVTALVDVLWGVGRGGGAKVVLASERALPPRKHIAEALSCYSLTDRPSLEAFLTHHLPSFAAVDGCGVLLLLYSVVLTAGVNGVRGMMDGGAASTASLIGAHGYCTQELVNLMLMGDACSNVFDGLRTVGGARAASMHG